VRNSGERWRCGQQGSFALADLFMRSLYRRGLLRLASLWRFAHLRKGRRFDRGHPGMCHAVQSEPRGSPRPAGRAAS
jgi:hypothetical protein